MPKNQKESNKAPVDYTHDLETDFVFKYTEQHVEFINTHPTTFEETAETLYCTQFNHTNHAYIQSVQSFRSNLTDPMLLVMIKEREGHVHFYTYNVKTRLHKEIEQTAPIQQDIAQSSMTRDPFDVVFMTKQTSDTVACYALVIGTSDGKASLILIHSEKIMYIEVIEDFSKSQVSSIFILTPNKADRRMGHSDPQILLGRSNGQVFMYRFRAHIYTNITARLRVPINLTDFVEFINYPITYLSCARSHNSLLMTIAIGQQKPQDPKYQYSRSYIKLIDTQGDAKQRKIIQPVDPMATILFSQLHLSTATTEELDSIIQLTSLFQTEDQYELGIWHISPRQVSQEVSRTAPHNQIHPYELRDLDLPQSLIKRMLEPPHSQGTKRKLKAEPTLKPEQSRHRLLLPKTLQQSPLLQQTYLQQQQQATSESDLSQPQQPVQTEKRKRSRLRKLPRVESNSSSSVPIQENMQGVEEPESTAEKQDLMQLVDSTMEEVQSNEEEDVADEPRIIEDSLEPTIDTPDETSVRPVDDKAAHESVYEELAEEKQVEELPTHEQPEQTELIAEEEQPQTDQISREIDYTLEPVTEQVMNAFNQQLENLVHSVLSQDNIQQQECDYEEYGQDYGDDVDAKNMVELAAFDNYVSEAQEVTTIEEEQEFITIAEVGLTATIGAIHEEQESSITTADDEVTKVDEYDNIEKQAENMSDKDEINHQESVLQTSEEELEYVGKEEKPGLNEERIHEEQRSGSPKEQLVDEEEINSLQEQAEEESTVEEEQLIEKEQLEQEKSSLLDENSAEEEQLIDEQLAEEEQSSLHEAQLVEEESNILEEQLVEEEQAAELSNSLEQPFKEEEANMLEEEEDIEGSSMMLTQDEASDLFEQQERQDNDIPSTINVDDSDELPEEILESDEEMIIQDEVLDSEMEENTTSLSHAKEIEIRFERDQAETPEYSTSDVQTPNYDQEEEDLSTTVSGVISADVGSIQASFVPASNSSSSEPVKEQTKSVDYIPVMHQELVRLSAEEQALVSSKASFAAYLQTVVGHHDLDRFITERLSMADLNRIGQKCCRSSDTRWLWYLFQHCDYHQLKDHVLATCTILMPSVNTLLKKEQQEFKVTFKKYLKDVAYYTHEAYDVFTEDGRKEAIKKESEYVKSLMDSEMTDDFKDYYSFGYL